MLSMVLSSSSLIKLYINETANQNTRIQVAVAIVVDAAVVY